MDNRTTQITYKPVDFDPFAGPEIERLIPITEPQAEIWTACQFGGDDANRAYNESVSLRLQGQLNREAFEKAWHSLTQHHESLRSAFSGDGTRLLIFQDLALPLIYTDAGQQPEAEQRQHIADWVAADVRHTFDLQHGPLVKASLIRLSDELHHFTLTAHHIICDGWSVGILLQDLAAFYSAYAQGRVPVVRPADSISRFAVEQQAAHESQASKQAEQYWVDQFRQVPPPLHLPTDFPRPSRRTFACARHDYPVDPALIRAVRKIGAQAGGSFVVTLLAAYEVLLHKLSGQPDLVLGLPAAGQPTTGYDRLVGHCVNLLPLRSMLRTDDSFSTYLARRKDQIFDALDHQQFTFGRLLQKIAVPRDPSRVPLVSAVFNVDMNLDSEVAFAGLQHQFHSNPRAFENFDLSVNATGSGDTLCLEWTYNTQLFRPETIQSFQNRFIALLETVVENPSAPLQTSPPTPAAAQPDTEPLHRLLSQTARQFPDKTAVRFRNQTLTYAELDQQANQLAHLLIANGVQKGDRIGLALERSAELIVSLLAIMKTGGMYIPVDPRHPTDRIQYVLADARCSVLLTNQAHRGRIDLPLRELILEDITPTLPDYPSDEPAIPVSPDDLIYVLYTSGTTGRPKGVQIYHRSVVNVLRSLTHHPGLTSADKTVTMGTIAFDITTAEIYLPLLVGAELVVVDADTVRNGQALAELFRYEAITFVQTTPATLRMLWETGWRGSANLRVISCAEALPKDLADKLLGSCRELYNYYGPTETTVYATGKTILPTDDLITIGPPIGGVRIVIVDEHLQPLPGGMAGELVIGGAGVGAGYLNQPQLSAEKFVTLPFAPGERFYRSGDLGRYLPNGDIQYLGRIDQQIKIRGHRIEPGEIEHQLLRLPGIDNAVVMAREDQPGDQRLVAYVVPGTNPTDEGDAGWKSRWDAIYEAGLGDPTANPADVADLDIRIAEQLSNQTDIREQANEWLKQSIKRIKALRARRILEVGSGAGQLLFELAPDTDSYIATDYAQSAIDNLNQQLTRRSLTKQGQIRAQVALADDYSMVEPASQDLVLVHSVAQYFPDLRYLLDVIRGAVAATAPGGCVFVGDMQMYRLQEQHHTADQLRRAADTQRVADFRDAVNRRIRLDDELMADPAFFYQLPTLIPAISAVDVQLREGAAINETTQYHFDVWLYVGEAPATADVDTNLDWNTVGSVESLESYLRQHPLQSVRLTGVPNGRTATDHALRLWIHDADGLASIQAIRQRLTQAPTGIDPNQFWQLAGQTGFRAFVRWASDGHDNALDVVFIPERAGTQLPPIPAGLAEEAQAPLSSLVSEPYRAIPTLTKEQIGQWRQQLAQTLPSYMVPTDFVALAKLPVTANGKIDRKALPAPAFVKKEAAPKPSGEPSTREEKQIAAIWQEIFGLPDISVDDNFFELGGHSMLAVRAMAQLERETGRRLPLSTLFEAPTIRALARLIQPDRAYSLQRSLVPIKPYGSKPPIFVVHGGGLNLLTFKGLVEHMDAEQPIYGFQARGLDGTEEPLDSMEAIAADYIEELLEHDPNGPYALAGYSFGGYVALEMARQLQQQGKVVKLLGMFDTNAEDSTQSRPFLSRLTWRLGRQIPKMAWIGRSLLEDPIPTLRYQGEYVERQVKGVLKAVGLANTEPMPLDDHLQRMMEKHETAFHTYRIQPYDGVIHVFKAKKRLYYIEDREFLGWKKFALRGLHIHDVPGDHATMLLPPNDKEFARILQKALDES